MDALAAPWQVKNLFSKRESWGKRCAASEKFQLKNDHGDTPLGDVVDPKTVP